MTNNSSTGGVLTPNAIPAPLEDDELDDLFAGLFSAITSIPGKLTRPRYQNPPPKQPDVGTNWVAAGVVETDPDDYPAIKHTGASDDGLTPGFDTLTDHEGLIVLVSFYGPNARGNLRVLCDGLRITQNTEPLLAYQIKYIDASKPTRVSALIQQQWVNRWDTRLTFRREVTRVYQIYDIASATVHLQNDDGHVNEFIQVNK